MVTNFDIYGVDVVINDETITINLENWWYKDFILHYDAEKPDPDSVDFLKGALDWLFDDYEGDIQLSEFEYDLLASVVYPERRFDNFQYLMEMKNKGYYEDVKPYMIVANILSSCELNV